MAGGYKVLIFGIPMAIEEDVLISSLLNFGRILTIYVDDGSSVSGKASGYVVYKTKMECYRAISALNGQSPHYLSMLFEGFVDLGDEADRKNEPEFDKSQQLLASLCPRNTQLQHKNVRSQHVVRGTRINCYSLRQSHVVVREVVEDEELSTYPSEVEDVRIRNYSSSVQENGVVVDSSTAANCISDFERDYTFGPKAQHSSYFEQALDQCIYCKRPGDESCGDCGVTYCSKDCQLNDWDRHQHECKPVKCRAKQSSSSGETSKCRRTVSQNVEKSHSRISDQRKSCDDVKGGRDSKGTSVEVKKCASEKDWEGIPKDKKLDRSLKESSSVRGSCSGWGRGGERERCHNNEKVEETRVEKLISLQSMSGMVKSGKPGDISNGVLSKETCDRTPSPGTNMKSWRCLHKYEEENGGDCSSDGNGSRSLHDGFTSVERPSDLLHSGVTKKANKVSIATKPCPSEGTSSLSVKVDKLISLIAQENRSGGSDVENIRVTSPSNEFAKRHEDTTRQKLSTDDNSMSEKVKTVTPPKVHQVNKCIHGCPRNHMAIASPEKLVKRHEDTTRQKLSTDDNSMSEKVKTVTPPKVHQVNKCIHGCPRNHMAIASPEKLVKVSGSPNTVQAGKPELLTSNQEKQSTEVFTNWNLFSNDPETQNVKYDLCTQQRKLPSDVFSEVKICKFLSRGNYWVQFAKEEDLSLIQRCILYKMDTAQVSFNPTLGNYCSAIYKGTWFRAKVLAMRGSEVVVLLIDHGNVIHASTGHLRELPSVVKSFYAQAIRVKVDPRTPDKYLDLKEGDRLVVKATGKLEGDVVEVQLHGVLYAKEVTVPKLLSSSNDQEESGDVEDAERRVQWPQSVLALLREGDEAACTVLRVNLSEDEDKDEIIVAVAFEGIAENVVSIAEDLINDCMELEEDLEFNPSVGDLVGSFSDQIGTWVRSIVLDTGTRRWLVACIDFGCVEEVTEVREIPDDKLYKRLFVLSAEGWVTKSLFAREDLFCEGRIQEGTTLCAKVLKKKDDYLECEIGFGGDQTLCFVELKVWSPKSNCSANSTSDDGSIVLFPVLESVKLTSGCRVKITSYFDSLVMYVQPCDEESKLLMEELRDSIAKSVVKSDALKELPVKGKTYICLYGGDRQYYRVVVKRIRSSNEIHVHYIDYGNEETVSQSRLFELPPELDKIPCQAVKIELKKNFNKPLNKEVVKYLSYLILEERELVLTIPDGSMRNAELQFSNNIVNDILKRFVDP